MSKSYEDRQDEQAEIHDSLAVFDDENYPHVKGWSSIRTRVIRRPKGVYIQVCGATRLTEAEKDAIWKQHQVEVERMGFVFALDGNSKKVHRHKDGDLCAWSRSGYFGNTPLRAMEIAMVAAEQADAENE
jgi:hypothetical protein